MAVCPDYVIQVSYEFADSRRQGVPENDSDEKGLDPVAESRRDLFRTVNMKTKLDSNKSSHCT
jgi:hypothetical protein